MTIPTTTTTNTSPSSTKPHATVDAKPSLLGLSLEELTEVALALGLPKFVGKQICGWLYDKHARSFEEMTNLSKAARQKLTEGYQIGILLWKAWNPKMVPSNISTKQSADTTSKRCTSLTGNALRSVFLRKWAAKWLVNFV